MTEAQAKAILLHWATNIPVSFYDKASATVQVLHRNNWIVPMGKNGTFPSGRTYVMCTPTKEAVAQACRVIERAVSK